MQPTNPDMPSDRLFSVLLDVVLFFRSVVVQVLPSLVIVFTVRSLPIWTRFMVAHLCFMQVNHGIAVPLFLKRCTICSFSCLRRCAMMLCLFACSLCLCTCTFVVSVIVVSMFQFSSFLHVCFLLSSVTASIQALAFFLLRACSVAFFQHPPCSSQLSSARMAFSVLSSTCPCLRMSVWLLHLTSVAMSSGYASGIFDICLNVSWVVAA